MGSARGASTWVSTTRSRAHVSSRPLAPGSATRREGSPVTDAPTTPATPATPFPSAGLEEFTAAERTAMRRALQIAGTPGVPLGPNPRVGCVLLDDTGVEVAEGFHRGAGAPHAEVEALTALSGPATGLTAVVTLEPCNHTGRTGPCSQALVEAGIARVVYAQADTNPV